MASSLQQWRSVGASVIGTHHKRLGEACEDALASVILPGGVFLGVVADGAGSAPAGKEGAQTVVAAALAKAVELVDGIVSTPEHTFYQDVLQQILQAARNALEERAQGLQALGDFATTLLFVLVTPQWFAALQLGDGAIVVRRNADELETVTVPDYEEYINETHFVTDINYLAAAHYVVMPAHNLTAVAVLSDGLQMLALDSATHKAYAPFFMPLFAFASQPEEADKLTKELEAFLTSERVQQRTDDDKTLLVAVVTHM